MVGRHSSKVIHADDISLLTLYRGKEHFEKYFNVIYEIVTLYAKNMSWVEGNEYMVRCRPVMVRKKGL